MGILILLLGLLTAASGGLKLHRGALGPGWARAELVLGAGTVLASGAGLGRARPLAWVVVAVVLGVLVCSSGVHVRRAGTARRARDASEGQRLRAHLGAPDERR